MPITDEPKIAPSAETMRRAQIMLAAAMRADAAPDDVHATLLRTRRDLVTLAADGTPLARADAAETNLLALQLEQLTARVVDRPYAQVHAMDVLNEIPGLDPNAESFAWAERDVKANFGWIADDGLPQDTVVAGESHLVKVSRPVHTAGGTVYWTDVDIRRAALSPAYSLPDAKLLAARQAADRFLDNVLCLGDTSRWGAGSAGLCNWATGTGNSQVRSTAFTAAAWTTGTLVAQTMLDNLNALVAEMIRDNDERMPPNVIAMPLFLRQRIASVYFTDGNPETVESRFKKGAFGAGISFATLPKLNNGGACRVLACYANPETFGAAINQRFSLRPPVQRGFGFEQSATLRTGGFVIYQPLGMRYGTGLPTS